jgi:hypothetical protein
MGKLHKSNKNRRMAAKITSWFTHKSVRIILLL